MILVDANILLYAHLRGTPAHAEAHRWLDQQLNGPDRVGLPWPSLLAFVRIASNPRLIESALSIDAAWRQVESWLDVERVWIPLPTTRHRELLAALLPHCSSSPKLVPDAHLAALAIEHGLTLCSADGDFARFPGLRWRNPLVPKG